MTRRNSRLLIATLATSASATAGVLGWIALSAGPPEQTSGFFGAETDGCAWVEHTNMPFELAGQALYLNADASATRGHLLAFTAPTIAEEVPDGIRVSNLMGVEVDLADAVPELRTIPSPRRKQSFLSSLVLAGPHDDWSFLWVERGETSDIYDMTPATLWAGKYRDGEWFDVERVLGDTQAASVRVLVQTAYYDRSGALTWLLAGSQPGQTEDELFLLREAEGSWAYETMRFRSVYGIAHVRHAELGDLILVSHLRFTPEGPEWGVSIYSDQSVGEPLAWVPTSTQKNPRRFWGFPLETGIRLVWTESHGSRDHAYTSSIALPSGASLGISALGAIPSTSIFEQPTEDLLLRVHSEEVEGRVSLIVSRTAPKVEITSEDIVVIPTSFSDQRFGFTAWDGTTFAVLGRNVQIRNDTAVALSSRLLTGEVVCSSPNPANTEEP